MAGVEPTQVSQIRAWVRGEAHADHDTFSMGKGYAEVLLTYIDGLTANDSVLVYRDLLESLVDDEDCHFDHHGGCQAHGYLSLDQGELCPQEELKRILHIGGR
jgi:hypothetical protein